MIESAFDRKELRQRYTGILDKCQDLAIAFSSSQLTDLFEHAGTVLLDFAERSEDNNMQGRFLEAMGLVQRRRPDMEHVFRREIGLGFKSFGRDGSTVRAIDIGHGSAEQTELTLMGQEEMEQHIAAERIVIKANESFLPELSALGQRLAVINGGRKLKDYEIPAGPHHLVQAFRCSMEGLDVDAKTKVILYALFDKFLVKQAKCLYEELNAYLVGTGILPNLKPVRICTEGSKGSPGQPRSEGRKSRAQGELASPRVARRQHIDAMEPVWIGDELFGSILDLLSQRSGSTCVWARPKEPVDPEAAAEASRDLVTAVGRVQARTPQGSVHATVAEAVAIPELETDHAFIEKVEDKLSREREQVISQIDPGKLSVMDAGLIDLVGMIFEFMLNDPVLPNLAKALLSHLHTPYLKVALIDRRLLVDARYPARRLLDQMVEAGSLWVDESDPQRGIFPALQAIVERVIEEFSEDVTLFEELLDLFERSMKEQQRKTDTIEQRTQNTAAGKERLRLAKRRAGNQIRSLLQRRAVPAPVIDFLSKSWFHRLVFILLRDKDEDRGDAWLQAVTTAESLVSLFDSKREAEPPAANSDRLAKLRTHLTDGIQGMGSYPRSALDTLLAFLAAPETWQEARATAVATSSERPGAKRIGEDLDGQGDALAGYATISQQEQDVIRQLSKTKFGTWFELQSTAGGAPRKVKLSWLSHLTATCLFVDRSGMQAEIKTLRELAQEVLSGRAKVIPRPRHPFIERALVAIRGILQGGEPPTPPGKTPQA
jgi:hypothetical protein